MTQELPHLEALCLTILRGTFSLDFSCAAQNWSRLPAPMTFCSEGCVGEELSPLQSLLPPRFLLPSFGFVSGDSG